MSDAVIGQMGMGKTRLAEEALALARHFGAALPLIRDGRRPDLLAHVLERLGESWEPLGETPAAIEVWTEAVADLEDSGDLRGVARLRRRLAFAVRAMGDLKWLGDYRLPFDESPRPKVERALRIAEEAGEWMLARRIHRELGWVGVYFGDPAGFDESANRRLLGRAARWLAPGGTLAVIDFLSNERRDGPRGMALYAVELVRRVPSGQVYPFSAYAGWLREAGCERLERVELSACPPVTLRARRP